MTNNADHLVRALAVSGVERIYGLAGDSLNGLTDAVRRADGMEWAQVRHEETAAFAAGAEAALTGELAVCAGSCGPGNLHLINGLYDAQRSRVPVLAIAAHIPHEEIGAAASHPGRQVVAMTGDGGLSMLLGELLTLVQSNLPVTVVVYNNASSNFVELEMKAAGVVTFGTELVNHDLAAVAAAMGLPAQHVSDADDLEEALAEALAHDGPSLVDVTTARQVLTMPPSITAEQVKGFALYGIRSVLAGQASELVDVVETNVVRRVLQHLPGRGSD